MSVVDRIHHIVQRMITTGNENNAPPTTLALRKEAFPQTFNKDSQSQREAVYGSIVRGRDQAVLGWENYVKSPQFKDDLGEIEFYANELIDVQAKTDDYSEFYNELFAGRFADKTELIKGNLREFALIAVLWDKKLIELSQKGMNLAISSYGRYSKWKLPSFWGWAIRETKLYVRFLNIVEKQINRGIKTGVGALPGTLPRKAIGYTQSAKAAITDGTSWTCECAMINIAEGNFCSNCGEPKP